MRSPLSPANGNLLVQIAYKGRHGKFTFERNAEAAAEKARAIFRCIVEDGWPVAIERYSPRAPVRCRDTFAELAEWLRGKGITARKPIHELRKECGTLLLKQGQPIEAVSRYLGHSTLQITMKHYADIAKRRATVDLSALMPADVAEFQPAEGTPRAESEGLRRARA